MKIISRLIIFSEDKALIEACMSNPQFEGTSLMQDLSKRRSSNGARFFSVFSETTDVPDGGRNGIPQSLARKIHACLDGIPSLSMGLQLRLEMNVWYSDGFMQIILDEDLLQKMALRRCSFSIDGEQIP